jgi:histidinol-phosphate phosphatase family protein
MKACLVAGGLGTRLRSISGDAIPKALVPVAGRPILFRQLELLKRHNVREVAMLAGHLAETLAAAALPVAAQMGLEARFFVEALPLGTAGGLTAAAEYLGGADFIVLYADEAVEMDLSRLLAFHQGREALGTIVCHPNDHPHESDLLVTDARSRVLQILPRKTRPPGSYRNLVPAGVYCCSPDVFRHIRPGVKQDFIGDVFPGMIASGAPLFAYNTPEYLRDMGTVERCHRVEQDILSGYMQKMHLSRLRPAVFFDRDGVLNVKGDSPGILSPDQLELLPGAAEAVHLANEAGWLAVLVTNQPVLAKGMITREQWEAIQARLETLLGLAGARLDRTYMCPHHPESGFRGEVAELKIDCACRKPKPGLLLQAMKELPVDRARSCVIGDSWRDFAAARAVGLAAYGVSTGDGARTAPGQAEPDRVFANVLEALTFAVGLPAQS